FTFSAAAVHGAARLFAEPPARGLLAVQEMESGEIEVYGESPSRPVFSAQFDLPADRAAALAAAELRLPPETTPVRIDQILRAPARLLDEFRGRSKYDLDSLNELTKLLAPPIWTNHTELTRDAVTIAGEAEQAAPLLKLVDSSPYFKESAFQIPIAKMGTNEM